MPSNEQRMKEARLTLERLAKMPMSWTQLHPVLREMAGVLTILCAEVEELSCVEAEQPSFSAHLEPQKILCHMLRKSRHVREGLRHFQSLCSNYGVIDPVTLPDDKNLNSYQAGFDRAVGELAKFLRVDEQMVQQWEDSVTDEEDVAEDEPRPKKKR